jgi:sugar lactone lactonase YvrE
MLSFRVPSCQQDSPSNWEKVMVKPAMHLVFALLAVLAVLCTALVAVAVEPLEPLPTEDAVEPVESAAEPLEPVTDTELEPPADTAEPAEEIEINSPSAATPPAAAPEVVFEFNGAMPTGVTVSQTGRIFVNYPRWGDPVNFTVAELVDGREVAYPDRATARLDTARADTTFVSVQSVVVDALDRLWVLDTGSINFGPVVPGGPKLVAIDLTTNSVVKTIQFPADVVLPTTYLNDVRFDLGRGESGVAYITDSSGSGPNGIIVVDLASGTSRRLLHDHPSTRAEADFTPTVEGKRMRSDPPGEPAGPLTIGADGIAISADGSRLYYCPLASRRLYSIAAETLLDPALTADQVAAAVVDEGEKPASDGLEQDAAGGIYATDYEHNAIVRLDGQGGWATVMQDERALWPDTLALAADGYLYFTANQLHRQPSFNDGKDRREKPYLLMRVNVDAEPVLLK